MGGGLGKLTRAALWVLQPAEEAHGETQDAEAEQALREFGVPEEQIAAARRHDTTTAKPALELWAWHERAFRVFDGLATQWRVVGTMAGLHYVGLDLSVLPVVEARKLPGEGPLDAAEFDQLRAMEIAGKRYLNS